ncbi:hypothetical protein IAT38_005439 [Cryptococcus sp. DSM 104549]
MFDEPVFGASNTNDVDLSTNTSTSSSALLSSVRAERLAREERRQQERAAVIVQKVWRGRTAARDVRRDTVEELEKAQAAGEALDVEATGRKLVVVLRDGVRGDRDRVEGVLAGWCVEAVRSRNGAPAFVASLYSSESWLVVLGILSGKILHVVSRDALTTRTPALLAALEDIYSPKSYATLPSALQQVVRGSLTESLTANTWVEQLVAVMDQLIAASPPKKKHPLLEPIVRLLTAPFVMSSDVDVTTLIPPLVHHLLAIPSLPSSLPLPALTHLSQNLHLFTRLLPYASEHSYILFEHKLSTELGKTCFLANLTTFGISGQMLARAGVQGAAVWMSVVGTVLSGMNEGWGRWVEGHVEEDEDVIMAAMEDSDDDDDDAQAALVPSKKAARPRRPTLAPSLRNKLVILSTPAHINALSQHVLNWSSSSPKSLMRDFAVFCLGLLSAFRGSPKWEVALDALVDGQKGRALMKAIWRDGVRGKWENSEDRSAWDEFNFNPSTPCLLLLSHMYCHYLLLTPDDEFVSPRTNPLNIDEILQLAAIWRDLAFWGYMNGVTSSSGAAAGVGMANGGVSGGKGRPSGAGMGNEEARALFTKGVTRVAERSARRQFADPDFWVMKAPMDMQGFVQAAVYEDAELSGANNEEVPDQSSLPRWAIARQRYTKRQMAYISPRLGLLNNLPMTVPFQTRLNVFRMFIEADQAKLGIEYHGRRFRSQAKIRRNHVAQDGFDELSGLGPVLKGRIDITFVDQYGITEMGIDGGGLFKEFLTILSKEVFDTNRGLWLVTDQNELYPNPHSYATESPNLSWYRFIGQVLGKAIYEGILVDVTFADFFLAKWLGRQSYLDDLDSLDKDLYKGLIILKNYANPEELALNFSVTEEEFGVQTSVDLVPGGSEISVTAENRHEYIQLVCKYKLDKQIAAQSKAFFIGLSDLVDAKWLRMFDQRELQQLIGGEETPIDIDDLRAHTVVTGFPNDVTPRLFWKVVEGFDQEQRKALLRFVTSCSRPPLLGFSQLNPTFAVKFSGGEVDRLPTASACFNLLKMPGYTTESALKAKLLQAITSGAGFDMS